MTVGRDRIDRVIDVMVAVPICSAVATRRAASIALQQIVRRMPGALAQSTGARHAPQVGERDETRHDERDPSVMVEVSDVVDDNEPTTPSEVTSSTSGAELPISDYDHLAARQVIERLRSLDPDEVAAIAAYERGNRRRSTVLGKLEQLGA